eukprot:gene18441-21983_t
MTDLHQEFERSAY